MRWSVVRRPDGKLILASNPWLPVSGYQVVAVGDKSAAFAAARLLR